MFSEAQCLQWLRNKSVNPITHRSIQPGKKIYLQLEKYCLRYNLLPACKVCFTKYISGLKCLRDHEFCEKCVETTAGLAGEKLGKVFCMTPDCDAEFPIPLFNKVLQDLLTGKQREIADRKTRAESDDNSLETEMTNIITRRCPVCFTLSIKSEGCNKLTCICGTTMCFICQRNISREGYKHFCNCGGDCTCDKCKTFDQKEKRDLIQIQNLALENNKCPLCNFFHSSPSSLSVVCKCGKTICFGCKSLDDLCTCNLTMEPILEETLDIDEIVAKICQLLDDVKVSHEIQKIKIASRLYSFIFSNFLFVLQHKNFHHVALTKCLEMIPDIPEPYKQVFYQWYAILKLFYDQY